MNHPTNEQWMSLLYGEAAADERAALEGHLAECSQCQSAYAAWKETRHDLDTWQLPALKKHRASPSIAWAAAAALVACAVFGGARVWTLEKEVGRLRADLQQQTTPQIVQSEVRRLIGTMTADSQENQTADRQAFIAALDKIQAADAERYALLRKELETVAILTEASFQRAQNEIANIADLPRKEFQQ